MPTKVPKYADIKVPYLSRSGWFLINYQPICDVCTSQSFYSYWFHSLARTQPIRNVEMVCSAVGI